MRRLLVRIVVVASVGEGGGGDVCPPLRGRVLVEHLDLDLVGVRALLVAGLDAPHAGSVLQVICNERKGGSLWGLIEVESTLEAAYKVAACEVKSLVK